MGDTRPSEKARIPYVEEIRLRTARWQPQDEASGEAKSDLMFLLTALDAVLSQPTPRDVAARAIDNAYYGDQPRPWE